MKWPGLAAVVVSVIHVIKGVLPRVKILDGDRVENITAFLFHAGSSEDPKALKSNKNKSFQGSIVLGMGFTFDDQDTDGVATPISEMNHLLEEDPKNGEIIFPYIGGQEVNSSPTHAHRRYVINFKDYPLMRMNLGKEWINAGHKERTVWLNDGIVPSDYPDSVANDWPSLLRIVEKNVKPIRTALPATSNWNKDVAKRWWQFAADRIGLRKSIAKLDRVLVVSGVSHYCSFAFLPSETVFSNALIIFATSSNASFCALQSRPHEIWARFFGSSLEDRLRYTPTDCFETFPFSADWESNSGLETAGREYYHFRMDLMERNDEGLTKIYNRFHDPYEDDPAVLKLRQLHAAMDREVLNAYGWDDVCTDCDFIPEPSADEEERTKRTQAVRYRWPDPVRNEVLGRLLELNAERAAKQKRLGKSTKGRHRRNPPSQSRPGGAQQSLVE